MKIFLLQVEEIGFVCSKMFQIHHSASICYAARIFLTQLNPTYIFQISLKFGSERGRSGKLLQNIRF